MIREMDRCPYCASPIRIGEESWVICEYCGREMEVTRFTQEEKRLVEVVEDARRSSEAAAEEVRRRMEDMSRAHSRETENAVNIAKDALETCRSALESLSSQLDRSEARKLRNLYAQAEEAQRAGRFEEAERWYRQVLITAGDEAEIYWRLVMCSYGIEYVREQATGKHLPTISHMVVDSILDNADYRAAVRLARSAEMRHFYEAEARHIDGILDKYRQVAATEEPYDVFISVKQGDELGNPTHDSLVAQDLYYMLVNEFGLKVFNSRISLSQYAGFEFEPYIMDALMRAKVMIVVGTQQEYMTSAWVRNEWRRFRWLKDNDDDSRRLIAWVSGMAVREIPREMGDLQAINAGSMGAMDTLRSIVKAAFSDRLKRKNDGDLLLERAAMYLEDGEFDQVDRCCERVLDKDPHNARAYMLKLCAHCKARAEEQLVDAGEALNGLGDYKRAMRFGDEKLKRRLEDYDRIVSERLAEAAKSRALLGGFEAEMLACEGTELRSDGDVQALEKRVRDLSGKMQDVIGAEQLLERCRKQMNRCRDAYAQIQEEAREKRRREQQDALARNRERQNRVENAVRDFENELLISARDARNLHDRIHRFVSGEEQFRGLEARTALLDRCENRRQACVRLLASLGERAEAEIAAFEREDVTTAAGAHNLSSRIQRFIDEQDDFSSYDNGRELLERCRKRIDECAALHHRLTELAEQDEKASRMRRERTKQAEKRITAFEKERVDTTDEALQLKSRIQQYIAEQGRFADFENGHLLLKRCENRMYECTKLYQELQEREEKIQRRERGRDLNHRANDFLREMEQRRVESDSELQHVVSEILHFISDNDNFAAAENSRELLQRFQDLRARKVAEHIGQSGEADWEGIRADLEKEISGMEKRKIPTQSDADRLHADAVQYRQEMQKYLQRDEAKALRERLDKVIVDAAQERDRIKEERSGKGLPRAGKFFIALLAATVSMILYMMVNGSAESALIRVALPVFGGVIAVISAIQAHNRKKTGSVLLSWAVLVMWLAFAAFVNGLV